MNPLTFTLTDVYDVVEQFIDTTGQPPAVLKSSHAVRERYIDMTTGEFGGLRGRVPRPLPNQSIAFNNIPWLVDSDCPPNTLYVLPASHDPSLHSPT